MGVWLAAKYFCNHKLENQRSVAGSNTMSRLEYAMSASLMGAEFSSLVQRRKALCNTAQQTCKPPAPLVSHTACSISKERSSTWGWW